MTKKEIEEEAIFEKEPVEEPSPEQTAAEEAEASAESEVPSPESPEKKEALSAQVLRLQADFDNFRKRTVREKAEWNRIAQESIFVDLLPVLDHFELGLKTAQELDAKSAVFEGFKLVYDQLQGLIKKFGVQVIDAVGKPFDPNLHEAMTNMPSEEYPADVVIDQNRKGYKLGDRLLRPAQVLVSSGPPAGAGAKTGKGQGK